MGEAEEISKRLMEGSRVRKIRQRVKMSQEQFAAALGVTTGTISRWEAGRARLSPSSRKRLEEFQSQSHS